jgi:hypothetical protein
MTGAGTTGSTLTIDGHEYRPVPDSWIEKFSRDSRTVEVSDR